MRVHPIREYFLDTINETITPLLNLLPPRQLFIIMAESSLGSTGGGVVGGFFMLGRVDRCLRNGTILVPQMVLNVHFAKLTLMKSCK